ncbi:hypothetical protein [Methanolobus sp.]|jgi:hypothetical protein|uniref:hypothetical protein n=1 Tax=Methanolobus sp. TaxID=1874737 RepID=UPI0025CBC09A|nr:hypothetical protein [Methanolobus sp.]
MLLNALAISILSTADAGIVTMVTPTGLPEYGILVVATLIWLLSAKEILSRSKRWNESLDSSLKMVTMPLLMTFVAMVIFKISNL